MNDEVAAILDKYEVLSYQTLFAKNPMYSKHNMPKDIDILIKPFVLSEEEKKIKTDLSSIAKFDTHIKIEILQNVDMSALNLDSLAALKAEHTVVTSAPPIAKASRKSKTGERKRRQPTKRLDDDDSIDDVDDTLSAVRKKFRSERRGRLPDALGQSTTSSLPPEVLQPILQEIFDEFWDLKMDPPELMVPFFSIITREKCDALGLPGFYDKVMQECTLANMNQKLKLGSYTSPDTFESDFHMMCGNVMTYFDAGTPQHNQAKDMMEMFTIRWKEAKEKLKM